MKGKKNSTKSKGFFSYFAVNPHKIVTELTTEKEENINADDNNKKLISSVLENFKNINQADNLKGSYDLDLKDATDKGGVSGSKEVKINKISYQLKRSILDKTSMKMYKYNGRDTENYGEVIASKIIRRLLSSDSFEAAPHVSLVYEVDEKKTLVASKYLKGDEVRTLDDFIEKSGTYTDFKIKKHIKLVKGSKLHGADPKNGEYDVMNLHAILRKDIAIGIAVSIIIGDHDINPGNFIVITQKGENRAARIDFGHAFNDLIIFKKLTGGAFNKDNQVLDYLNRQKIDGGEPKLWRDYPGMIPSQEMADAFKKISTSHNLKQGIKDAFEEFGALFYAMDENKDEQGKNHLIQSLRGLSNRVGIEHGTFRMFDIFKNIEHFVMNNQEKMATVGELMQLQVDIDKMLENKYEIQISKIQEAYSQLKGTMENLQENGIL